MGFPSKLCDKRFVLYARERYLAALASPDRVTQSSTADLTSNVDISKTVGVIVLIQTHTCIRYHNKKFSVICKKFA